MGRKSYNLGAVVRIRADDGCAFMQYVYDLGDGKHAMRVLRGLHDCASVDARRLVAGPTQFMTVFMLDPRDTAVEHVGDFPIPPREVGRPRFRVEGGAFADDGSWLLLDGDKTQRLGRTLTEDEARLSVYGVAGAEFIVSRVRRDYRPEDDTGGAAVRQSKRLVDRVATYFPLPRKRQRSKRGGDPPSAVAVVTGYFYPSTADARRALLAACEQRGWQVHDRDDITDPTRTLTVVEAQCVDGATAIEMDEAFLRIAAETGAEYDGNEVGSLT